MSAYTRRKSDAIVRAKKSERKTEMQLRRFKHWTYAEDERLRRLWGGFSLAAIAERLRRTKDGVAQRAIALKLGPARRGTITLEEFCRTRGQCLPRVKRAIQKLGLVVPRAPSAQPILRGYGKHSALDDDFCDALDEFFASWPDQKRIVVNPKRRKNWGDPGYPLACVECGSPERRCHARFRCVRCYQRVHHAEDPERVNSRRRAAYRRIREDVRLANEAAE